MNSFKTIIKLNKEYIILNILFYILSLTLQSFDNLEPDSLLNYILFFNMSVVFLDLVSNWTIINEQVTNTLSKQLKIFLTIMCYMSYLNFYYNINAHKHEEGIISNQILYDVYKNKLYNINSLDEIKNPFFIQNIHILPNINKIIANSSCNSIKKVCETTCTHEETKHNCAIIKQTMDILSDCIQDKEHPCL